jgi:hypothetical protein
VAFAQFCADVAVALINPLLTTSPLMAAMEPKVETWTSRPLTSTPPVPVAVPVEMIEPLLVMPPERAALEPP